MLATGNSAAAAVELIKQTKPRSITFVCLLAAPEGVAAFTEAGFDVATITGLRCSSATSIAEVGRSRLEEIIEEIDGDDVEAIVQVGTNLSFVEHAAELETRLGKPVIAINMATLWHALRTNGIDDRIEGVGRLLAEH